MFPKNKALQLCLFVQGSTGEQELEEDLNGEKRLQRINRSLEILEVSHLGQLTSS